jgi:hypothetical protein
MPRVRPEDIVRHFRENGLKLLFHEPGNVRDLLALRDPDRAARIDFARMTIDPTTYVAADYRHLASDLVLKAPYRTRRGGRRRGVTLYVLLEHQSEPDAGMQLRVLDYLVQIYKTQVRAWERRHGSRACLRLQPVLPVVLYTGERRWDTPAGLAELVEGREEFADVLPQLNALFLSLPAIPAAELEAAGGYLGWVLELIQQRHAPPAAFRVLVARAVSFLEGMPAAERDRWLLFLSYIQALIYHDRPEGEHEELRQLIVESVSTDPRRREVEVMTRSYADVLLEEGRVQGRRETEVLLRQQLLVRQLRRRFGRLPRPVEQVIRGTDDIARLDAWLDSLVTAETLDAVGISAGQ